MEEGTCKKCFGKGKYFDAEIAMQVGLGDHAGYLHCNCCKGQEVFQKELQEAEKTMKPTGFQGSTGGCCSSSVVLCQECGSTMQTTWIGYSCTNRGCGKSIAILY